MKLYISHDKALILLVQIDHYIDARFPTWSSIFMMHVKAWDQHQYQQLGTMMFTACLPKHSQNPTRTNRSSGLIRNSYLLNKQMIIDHLFWLSRSKGMTVDIWIRDYNPPRCFQKKISGRSKHNDEVSRLFVIYFLSICYRWLGGTNVGVVSIRMFHVNLYFVAIMQINPTRRGWCSLAVFFLICIVDKT
jgi:hypothetical protein